MTPARPPLWYTAAWALALPAAALHLCWRALRQREYLRHWGERFLGRACGAARAAAPTPAIWLHAVSVGETRAAWTLLETLARAHAGARFVLTHMTPTGRAAGAELARALPGRVRQRYLPYDVPCAVRRFLREEQPRVGVLMETEIWPNLLAAAHAARIPLLLANARLSQRSLEKGLRHGRLMRAAAACVSAVGAQTPADAARIARLYDGPLQVTGNLKFDLLPEAQLLERGQRLRARWRQGSGAARATWLFASTRAGEERLLLEGLRARGIVGGGGRGLHGPRLLFVPRHPQRFDEVAELLRAAGATVLRRAQWRAHDTPGAAPAPGTAAGGASVLLGDSMGEMAFYYGLADVAFIGGSLLPLGGQNLIEACACGCPVVFGPYMFNFAQAAQDAIAAGAAQQLGDAGAVLAAMERLAGDEPGRRAAAQCALDFAQAHRGATARTAALIDHLLAAAGRA